MVSAAASSTSTACSPRPRRSTPPRGSRCSTSSCASARGRPASRSSRSTRSTTTTSTSTASRAPTGPGRSWPPAGIELPEGTPDDPPDAQTVHGLGNRKNEICCWRRSATHGVEAYDGSVRYVQAVRGGRAAPRRGVVQRQLPRGAGRRRASRTCSRSRIDGVVAEQDTCAASPPRTPTWPGRGRSAWSRPRRRSSRTPWPGWQAGRAGRSASWSAWTASGRRRRCGARRGHRRQGPGRAAGARR